MCSRSFVFASVLFFASSFSAQAVDKQAVTGIFSDLYYNDEGGDLLGTEIFIVFDGNDRYVAFFQHWEGGGDPAIVVSVTTGPNNHVSFEIPEPALGAGIYEGNITKAGFDGVWIHRMSNGHIYKYPIRLKRKKSYWQ